MDALIQGTISALGYLEDGVYYQEPDCFGRCLQYPSSLSQFQWALKLSLQWLKLELLDLATVSETIRDLIRFLRTDDKVMLARKICGELNIIENDLIPIIKSPNLKDDMFDITLR